MSTPNPQYNIEKINSTLTQICLSFLVTDKAGSQMVFTGRISPIIVNGISFNIDPEQKHIDHDNLDQNKNKLKSILEYLGCKVIFEKNQIKIEFPTDQKKLIRLMNTFATILISEHGKFLMEQNAQSANAANSSKPMDLVHKG